MAEIIAIASFIMALLACLILGQSILIALAAGFFIFFGYALYRGFAFKQVLAMAAKGVKTVKNILITFVLIGLLTAVWRAGGTIAGIISYSMDFVNPSIFLFIIFLLCCLVSFLTGTSLGSAATMGVIAMTMARSMGLNLVLCGGAVMSGIYFGDRCSPVSTSALLVSELTKTDIYDNVKAMLKSGMIPFLISGFLYLFIGMGGSRAGELPDVKTIFSQAFTINALVLIPALLILLLAAFRVKVKATLSASVAAGFMVCLMVQRIPFAQLLRFCIFGFESGNAQIASMLNGGGILSMVRVACIVGLSSSYSGIFEETGMLKNLQDGLIHFADWITPFGVICLTSVVTSMISCNQTLAIILTDNLCLPLERDQKKMMIALENSAVLIAPLVPWAVASQLPLQTIGAGPKSLFMAFFLYLVPISHFIRCKFTRVRTN